MRIKLLAKWESLQASYLLVPLLLTIVSLMLAPAMITFDEITTIEPAVFTRWIYTGGADGARTLLSTVAGSIITVAGVAYSITIAALALASTQFGPRLLRNFINDRANQTVLGTFVATFLYCLLVLRSVRSTSEGQEFVPHFSVSVAVILAVVCLVLLVYFFHRVAASIQAPVIAANAAHKLHEGIDRLYPSGVGHGAPRNRMMNLQNDVPPQLENEARSISATELGYVQGIDMDELFDLARRHDLIIKLGFRPGDFVMPGTPLVWLHPGERAAVVREETVRRTFAIGPQRTPLQDAEFGINQLVEIGVRALSPAINDPFTAMTCLDHLGAALRHILQVTLPSPYRYDDDDNLRLIAERISFNGLANAAFNLIRQYGRDSAAVTIRLLETIALVAPAADGADEKAVLLRHAEMTRRDCQLADENDRADVEARYQKVREALGA
jgi:uncharacterized membrane protein